jgi:DNA-binding NtrC family response regulator
LVDDEPTVLKLTKMILERQDFEITAFDSPIKALESVNPKDFELIISDLVMPKMNGIEFLKEVRLQVPHSKAIIISASAELARLQEDAKNETYFLSKPFKFDELVDLINSIL